MPKRKVDPRNKTRITVDLSLEDYEALYLVKQARDHVSLAETVRFLIREELRRQQVKAGNFV